MATFSHVHIVCSQGKQLCFRHTEALNTLERNTINRDSHLFFPFFFFGLPTGNGLNRQPIFPSSLLIKLSLPSGLPVCVFPLSLAISVLSISSINNLFHCPAPIISYHFLKSSRSEQYPLSICAAALDQIWSDGLRHIFARTGLHSIYLIAARK